MGRNRPLKREEGYSQASVEFDFRAYFCHSALMETHASGFRLPVNAPEGPKRFPISPKAISYQSKSDFLSVTVHSQMMAELIRANELLRL
jgi:hypothetical protein